MSGKDQIFGRLLKLKSPNRDVVTMDAAATVEVLANKFYIVDPTDTTKRMRFDASGITTATDRTQTLPDANVGASGAGLKRNVLSGAANLTLTAALSGSIILVDGATQAYTLPAVAAVDIGTYFDFLWTVASTTVTITAQAGDILTGGVHAASTTAGGNDAFSADATDDLIITFNGTTQGGAIGSELRVTAISATRWYVQGAPIGSGTLISNFT